MPSNTAPSFTSAHRAIIGLFVAATLWGIFWYPLRLLAEHGLTGLWATFLIYISALLVGLPVLWRRRAMLAQYPWLMLGIALANGWCNIAFILALLEGTVVRVLLLFYLSPLWTVMLGAVLLKERPSRFEMGALGLAMLGAFITLWEPALGLPWPQGKADWLAISSGMAFALSNVLVRKAQHVPVSMKTAITWLGVVALSGAGIVIHGLPVPTVGAGMGVAVFALGALGIVVMTWAVQYGVTNMPVHRSAVILLFEVVAGAISAQLLTHEVVLPREWIGGTLILLAGWFAAARDEDKSAKPP